MTMETLNLLYWHWWLMAVVLFIVEVLVPGAFFLWMGVSAVIVGALAALFPGLETTTEFIIFAILSVASVIAWKFYQIKKPSKEEHSTLNRRAEQYIGRVITLTKPIENGFGKEKVGATFWTLQGPDLDVGTKVKIVGVDSATFIVDKA